MAPRYYFTNFDGLATDNWQPDASLTIDGLRRLNVIGNRQKAHIY